MSNPRDILTAHTLLYSSLLDIGIPHETAAEIALASSELTKNAVGHAGSGQLTVSWTPGYPAELEVIVTDCGPGIAGIPQSNGALPTERFREGLALASQIFSSVRVANRPNSGAQAVGRLSVSRQGLTLLPITNSATSQPDGAPDGAQSSYSESAMLTHSLTEYSSRILHDLAQRHARVDTCLQQLADVTTNIQRTLELEHSSMLNDMLQVLRPASDSEAKSPARNACSDQRLEDGVLKSVSMRTEKLITAALSLLHR